MQHVTDLNLRRSAWPLPLRIDPEHPARGDCGDLAGLVVLEDKEIKPKPLPGQQLSANHDDGVPDLVAGRMIYTRTPESIGNAAAVAAAWAATGAAAKQRIEAAAERERMRYLTGDTGMALTYDAKRQEAQRFASDGNPQASSLSLRRRGGCGARPHLAGMVQLWQVNIAAWAEQLGPTIEAKEQEAKLAVDAPP